MDREVCDHLKLSSEPCSECSKLSSEKDLKPMEVELKIKPHYCVCGKSCEADQMPRVMNGIKKATEEISSLTARIGELEKTLEAEKKEKQEILEQWNREIEFLGERAERYEKALRVILSGSKDGMMIVSGDMMEIAAVALHPDHGKS